MKTELTNYDIERLDRGDCQEVLFRGVVGSRAYGTANENSDTDIRGIFAVPSSAYVRLQSPPKQVSDERNDRTYYSLLRFCELLSSGNPTGIEMLYLPGDCVLKSTPAYSRLLADRNMFITRKVVDSHFYYALSQMKKARGANKRVWNPWPEEPPSVEEYCLFLDNAKGLAVPVSQAGVDLSKCKVSRLIVGKRADLFALYDYADEADGGVFHSGMLVESDMKTLDPARRIGVLVYNEQAFNSAKRQHREYWDWRRNRNESRWTRQENGDMDYDAKNMMHLVRLLLSAENIVREGVPIVRFDGGRLDMLLSIRRGEWSFKDIMALAEEKKSVIESGRERLPPDCDLKKVDLLIADIMREIDR